MPELPEVESIRLGLLKSIVSQKILNVEIRNEKIVSSNSNIRKADQNKTNNFIKNLIGKKIININRRAKNIIIEMDDANIILIHLKMTGQLIYNPFRLSGTFPEGRKNTFNSSTTDRLNSSTATSDTVNKHTHIIFELENGKLLYNDVRQFGYVLYYKDMNDLLANKHFKNLGVEPFEQEFTLKYLKEKFANTNKNIKSALLSQNIVVGIGNIYADEICFASNLLPQRLCKTLNEIEMSKLYKNIKNILSEAIASGGSSVSDYKLVNGESGKYQNQHKVYGRYGQVCYGCGDILAKSVTSARTTIYCLVCQK